MSAEEIAKIVGAIAIVASGGFFLYKMRAGFFYVNMVVRPTFTRQISSDPMKDHLTVSTLLIKGEHGSVIIHDGQVIVKYDDQSDMLPFEAIHRLSYRTDKSLAQSHKTISSKQSLDKPLLNLTPGDETTFSCSCLVPFDAVVTMQVTILACTVHRKKIAQWRSSVVSLPLLDISPNGVSPSVADRVRG